MAQFRMGKNGVYKNEVREGELGTLLKGKRKGNRPKTSMVTSLTVQACTHDQGQYPPFFVSKIVLKYTCKLKKNSRCTFFFERNNMNYMNE